MMSYNGFTYKQKIIKIIIPTNLLLCKGVIKNYFTYYNNKIKEIFVIGNKDIIIEYYY